MQNFIYQFQYNVALMQQNLSFILSVIGILYAILFLNWLLRNRLNLLGLYPRSISGIFGIFFAPFLHANFNHLFFNSIPLFILMNFVLLNGYHVFWMVTAIIVIFSGVAVWLFGRPSIHIGASGLILGYWSFLLVSAFQEGIFMAVVLTILCLYYFGSFVLEIVPTQSHKSWEYHLFGFIAGLIATYFYHWEIVCKLYLSR